MRCLGLDVGTTNTKAVLVDVGDDVRVVAGASAPTPAGGAELLGTVRDLVRQVVGDEPPAAVGVASMAETGVPLDADDRPLGDLVRWNVRRGGGAADRLARELGAAELFASTGVRASGKVPLAVWAHLSEHEPDRWARMRRWAGAADLVVLGLTGRLVTDHTLAGRTMAYRLPAPGTSLPRTFDADLLATVGLRPEQLPEVAGPDQVAGRVAAGGLAGLRAGTPVVVAGHDHQVGAWAGGMRAPGDVADSLGTAESVIRVLATRPGPAAVAAAGMSLVRTVGGAHEALVAGSPAAGAMLAWCAERLGGAERLAELLTAAAERPRHPDSPVVLPYLRGRQAPVPDPDAAVSVVGTLPEDDDVGLVAAVVDGLALHARWLMTAQAELAGVAAGAGAVLVLGAAAREGSAWMRAKAAAGPARMRVVDVAEPVAAGAALLAAHRAGLVDGTLLPVVDVPTGPVRPYDALYHRFVRAAVGG
ncbi:MAG TPA: FGGY family carbohydrate kinase [Actinomycetaceae bacterium]|nr:FGGY family carbohydrate kinase [Actinomycetaceae bacterium]